MWYDCLCDTDNLATATCRSTYDFNNDEIQYQKPDMTMKNNSNKKIKGLIYVQKLKTNEQNV